MVYLHSTLAGMLTQSDKGYTFSYQPDYQGRAISLSLPLNGGPFFSEGLHPFFQGLAPEGWLRKRYSEIQHLDEKDLLGMLIANNQDLLGAITLELNNDV